MFLPIKRGFLRLRYLRYPLHLLCLSLPGWKSGSFLHTPRVNNLKLTGNSKALRIEEPSLNFCNSSFGGSCLGSQQQPWGNGQSWTTATDQLGTARKLAAFRERDRICDPSVPVWLWMTPG